MINPSAPHEEKKFSTPLFGLGLIVVLTFLAGIVPASWFGIQPAQKNYARIDLSSVAVEDIARDRDKNGEITWKEIVTESIAPSELDTMGKKEADPKVIARLNDPDNLTSSFSKNLYLASTYLSKNGVSDAQAQQEVMDQLIAQEASKISVKTYTLEDLTLAKSESKASVKAYGNSVASILGNLITETTIMDTIGSIQAYLETKDPEALPPLEKERSVVETKLKKMLELPIPPSSQLYHILAVNKLSAYLSMLSALSGIQEDPLKASLFVDNYPYVMLSVLQTYTNLGNYFNVQNVIFSSKDPGYVFTVGYTLK